MTEQHTPSEVNWTQERALSLQHGEQNHTPGPWHIDWNGDMAPRILGLHAPGVTREIADVRFHNGSDDSNVHANARLIASAPETAAERDRLRNMLESIANNRLSTDIPPDEKLEHDHAQGWDSLVLAARAALKAGGG